MRLQKNTRIFLLSLIFPTINICHASPDGKKEWEAEHPLDEVKVIIQICQPNKTVSFEDVEVNLVGIPKARTLREARAANGYQGAGDSQATTEEIDDPTDLDKVTVRRWLYESQPESIQQSGLSFGETLKWKGQFSDGAGSINLWSSTDKKQPVYEIQGHRQDETVALHVATKLAQEGSSEFVTYWFKLPSKIPKEGFSGWLEPISQETRENIRNAKFPTFWNLTHGKDMEIHTVEGAADLLRIVYPPAE